MKCTKLLCVLTAFALVLSSLPLAAMMVTAETVTATQITSFDELVTGEYVIATDTGYAMTVHNGASSAWILSRAVTSTDGVISDVTQDMIWTVTVDGASAQLTDSNGVSISPAGGNSNGIETGDYFWAVTFADGKFQFAGTGDDTVLLAANANNSSNFRAYKTTTVSGASNGYPANFYVYAVNDASTEEPPEDDVPEDITCNEVTSIDQFVFDGTVNRLTANIDAADVKVHLHDPAQNLVIDLNGFTWTSANAVLWIDNGASATVYDSSEAKTGKIQSTGNDAIDISNGNLTLKDITVEGGVDGCDAVFANGGNITIENCTLSAGKAGIDAANGSAAAGVPVVAVITDTVFDTHAYPGDRNCAIELRASSDDQMITLVGNNVFENNKIMIRDDYTKGAAAGIVAAEGATVSFTDPVSVAGRNNYTYCEITYTRYDIEYGYALSWGTCGDSVNWSLYDSGILVISGTGAMEDYYSYSATPWYSYKDSITSVIIENGVTSIGDYAFYGCTSLESVIIPDSVTTIGNNAFYYCTSLATVYYGGSAEGWAAITIDDYNDPLINAEILYNGGRCGDNIMYTTSDDGVLTISGTGAMEDYYSYSATPWYSYKDSITSVIIENGVTSIGDYAFYDCESLASVTIPDSVTSIGDNAFRGCTSLAKVYITDVASWCGIQFGDSYSSPLSNGANLYLNGEKATELLIPDTVTYIGKYAFTNCASITSVVIPDSVTSIGEDAFKDCTSLRSVYITDIEAWANISFGGSYSNPFYYAGDFYLNGELVTELVVPKGLNVITDDHFKSIECITALVIPEGVTVISSNVFDGCEGLRTVSLPRSLIKINANAFNNCPNIEKVYYAGTISEWNDIAINGNTALTRAERVCRVSIDNQLGAANEHGAHVALGSCGNTEWALFEDGYLKINGDGEMSFTELPFYKYRNMIKTVCVDDGIISIPADAFYKCEALETLILPSSITQIGDSSFWRCTSLLNVYYYGTQEQWASITVNAYNDALLNAEFIYEYAPVTVASINVLLSPEKTEYTYGEELSLDGIIVMKTLSDGNVYEVEEYTVSQFDKYSYGKQTLTVTSSGATATFAVTVKASEADGVIEPVTLGMTVLELKASYDGYTVYVLDSDKSTVLGDNDVIKTGCIIQLVQDGQVVDSQAVAVKCDVDGDGKLSAKDFIRLKKQILLGGCVDYPEYADANGDGTVNEKDLEYLAQMIA